MNQYSIELSKEAMEVLEMLSEDAGGKIVVINKKYYVYNINIEKEKEIKKNIIRELEKNNFIEKDLFYSVTEMGLNYYGKINYPSQIIKCKYCNSCDVIYDWYFSIHKCSNCHRNL